MKRLKDSFSILRDKYLSYEYSEYSYKNTDSLISENNSTLHLLSWARREESIHIWPDNEREKISESAQCWNQGRHIVSISISSPIMCDVQSMIVLKILLIILQETFLALLLFFFFADQWVLCRNFLFLEAFVGCFRWRGIAIPQSLVYL